jgi:hypothetical protein
MYTDLYYDGPKIVDSIKVVATAMGTPLTVGRRTAAITSLNLAGKKGLPQVLSSASSGTKSFLESADSVLALGLTFAERAATDAAFVVGEAFACRPN